MGDLSTLIEELEEEKRAILKASAKFGLFLKKNSVMTYNDAMTGYIDLMIRQEKEKAAGSQVDSISYLQKNCPFYSQYFYSSRTTAATTH